MDSQEERFRSIYNYYMPLLRWMAGHRGIPYDEIEDLVQETFMEFYGHYPLTWPERKIRASLVKTMRNLCTDYWRRSHTRRMVYIDPTQGPGLTLDRIVERDTLSIVMERQEYRDLLDALKNMKEEWALVLVLYVIQGRPMDEVARMLGISVEACRTRLMRGRKHLRDTVKLEYLRSKEGENPLRKKRPDTSGDSEVPGNANA